MIDRYLLRYFLAVIDQGNFSRAAQHCRVSQPTLSVGIAKLEGLLKRALFNRTNRRVELTAAGTQFAVRARRIEAEFAAAEREVEAAEARQLLRIGVGSTLPSSWIEAALRAVGQGACKDRLEIVDGRARDLLPRMERGSLDGMICAVGDDTRVRGLLFEEGYALALSVDHRLADRASIDAEDVADEPMIVRRHCEVLPEVSRFFTARGVRPFMAARTMNDDRAVAYVRAGLGITVMPDCFATDGLAMVPLAGFNARRTIGVLAEATGAPRLEDSQSYRIFAGALQKIAAQR